MYSAFIIAIGHIITDEYTKNFTMGHGHGMKNCTPLVILPGSLDHIQLFHSCRCRSNHTEFQGSIEALRNLIVVYIIVCDHSAPHKGGIR